MIRTFKVTRDQKDGGSSRCFNPFRLFFPLGFTQMLYLPNVVPPHLVGDTVELVRSYWPLPVAALERRPYSQSRCPHDSSERVVYQSGHSDDRLKLIDVVL